MSPRSRCLQRTAEHSCFLAPSQQPSLGILWTETTSRQTQSSRNQGPDLDSLEPSKSLRYIRSAPLSSHLRSSEAIAPTFLLPHYRLTIREMMWPRRSGIVSPSPRRETTLRDPCTPIAAIASTQGTIDV